MYIYTYIHVYIYIYMRHEAAGRGAGRIIVPRDQISSDASLEMRLSTLCTRHCENEAHVATVAHTHTTPTLLLKKKSIKKIH